MHLQKIRHHMTSISFIWYDNYVKRAAGVVQKFIRRNNGRWVLAQQMRKVHVQLRQMQYRFQDQIDMRLAKIRVLKEYWNKMYFEISKVARRDKDEPVKFLMKKINIVPDNVVTAVLAHYVDKCRELYQIAFFQNRKLNPSKVRFDIEEIEELVDFRLEYTFGRTPVKMAVKEKTKQNGQIPVIKTNFMTKYNIDTNEKKPHQIHQFE